MPLIQCYLWSWLCSTCLLTLLHWPWLIGWTLLCALSLTQIWQQEIWRLLFIVRIYWHNLKIKRPIRWCSGNPFALYQSGMKIYFIRKFRNGQIRWKCNLTCTKSPQHGLKSTRLCKFWHWKGYFQPFSWKFSCLNNWVLTDAYAFGFLSILASFQDVPGFFLLHITWLE